MRVSLITLVIACAACGDNTLPNYEWDGARIVCSSRVDDLLEDPRWDRIEAAMRAARDHDSLVVLHAHVPNESVSLAAIERVFDLAAQHGLAYLTFDDLAAGATQRPALAFSFDDNRIDSWYPIRDLLTAHGARVTFWITRYHAFTPEQRAQLHQLASLGHDVQAHSVDHLNAPEYVQAYGLGAYLANEALPSIDRLISDGYPVTAYALPFGASTNELDAALLDYVAFVRTGIGSCPD